MKDYTKRLNEAKLAAEEGAEVTVEKKLLYAPDEGSLEASVNWFITNDIPLYGIQTNPTQAGWTNSPKAYGQCIIDDICFGIPLIKNEGERPHVDWITLEKQLEEAGYFEGENNEQV